MEQELLKIGFIKSNSGGYYLRNKNFALKAWLDETGWVYTWKSLQENVGGGPSVINSAKDLKFYL